MTKQQDRARAVADKFAIANVFPSLEAMVEAGVDVIHVLTPPSSHADVAIRATYQESRSVVGRCISPIAWAVFGANSFDGARFKLLTDPARHTWVAFADDTALARPAKWLRDHGVDESRIVYKVNTLLGIAEAVANEIGLALLPCYIGEATPGITRLSPPLPELEGQLWIVAHPDLRRIGRVGAFLDFCEAEMVKQCNPVCHSSPAEGAP